jgi:hypothetical protein
MNLRLITIIAILTASCKTKIADWQTLDFGDFKIKTPTDWRKFKEQGVDAYVGGLTNGKDSLWFYYGWYISGFKDEEASKYLYAQDTVNGKIAAIKLPKKNGKGSIQMFINNVTEKDKFEFSSNYVEDTNTIFRIFKSVNFNNSDTTRNGILTQTKFKEYPIGSGRTMYYANCSPCHHEYKNMTGPALTPELLDSRPKEWLYTFFKERKSLVKDSSFLARQKEFSDLHCIELTDYSGQDVEQLISYLKGQ